MADADPVSPRNTILPLAGARNNFLLRIVSSLVLAPLAFGAAYAGGWVFLESERAAGVPAVPPHWDLLKSKSAGEVGYHLARIGVTHIGARAGQ